MADKKISQLTLASTPLSGGETLPVVQTGATVQVSVNNLTAGRAVSATSISAGLGAVGTPAYTFTGDTNTGMWSPAADTIAFSTAGSERLLVTSTGNVGIGRATPANRLSVQDDTAPTFVDTTLDNTAMLVCVRGAGLNNFGASLGFSRLDSPGRVNAAIAIKQTTADSDQCGLSFFTHPSASTGTSLLEAMSITHAGNVGIGITAPRSILSAASATGSVLTLESTDTTLIANDVVGKIDFYANDGSTNGTGVKASVRAFANDATGNNIALAFATSDGTTLAADRMILDGQGRLGIGTTTPDAAARLDVSSTTSGFLPPRMTEAQRDLIATPPDGLMLYNSTTNKLQVRAAGSWVDLH